MRGQGRLAARAPSGGAGRRRIAVGVSVVLLTVALVVVGPRAGAKVARELASIRISAHEFGAAERWLAWSALLDPYDYHTDLLKASCYRQMDLAGIWRKALDEAARKGAPRAQIALEVKLGRYQQGGLDERPETEMENLVAAGASPCDVFTAFFYGYLARGNANAIRLMLEKMPENFGEAHQEYLWGLYFRKRGDLAQAAIRLTSALDAQPGHEPARAVLADLIEAKHDLAGALRQYVELAIRSRGSEAATLGLARVLRKQARIEEARAILAPLASQPEPPLSVRLEMAEIELESGNYPEAERPFRQMRLDEATDAAILISAAITLALRKKPLDAEPLFAKVADQASQSGWILEQALRLPANRVDPAAGKKARQQSDSSLLPALGEGGATPKPAAKSATDKPDTAAAELFRVHCSACHGVRGDAHGQAAHSLFPRPRDLRNGRCQLVSTRNGVPALEDIQRVLTLGMPGTPMQTFEDLSEADRKLLAQEVLRLRREGVRDQITKALREEGEEIDEAEVRRAIKRLTTPGERVHLPAHWPAPGEAAAKGKAGFAALGCVKCHGDDGIGAPEQSLFDDFGEPSRPRDLVHEPFKGGREPESIYLRISAGMPGTADPAVPNLPQEQLIQLVDYIRSLAREPQRMLTNYERRVLADGVSYREWLKHSSIP